MLSFCVEPIDSGRCAKLLYDERAGALAIFEGRVRNQHHGRPVTSLSYEAAPLLAQREFARIVSEVKAIHPFLSVSCVHRVGHLDLGETAIWLGVLAPHRKEAFLACERLMSEIKQRLPIWKKEFFADGSVAWVDDACGCVQHAH